MVNLAVNNVRCMLPDRQLLFFDYTVLRYNLVTLPFVLEMNLTIVILSSIIILSKHWISREIVSCSCIKSHRIIDIWSYFLEFHLMTLIFGLEMTLINAILSNDVDWLQALKSLIFAQVCWDLTFMTGTFDLEMTLTNVMQSTMLDT